MEKANVKENVSQFEGGNKVSSSDEDSESSENSYESSESEKIKDNSEFVKDDKSQKFSEKLNISSNISNNQKSQIHVNFIFKKSD